ncbi:MAG: hypothetical protein ACIALR_17135 [Blastopirellula sp. JB062]
MDRNRDYLILIVALTASLAVGCGQRQSVDGTIVSGEVLFQGEPVPAGIVKLEPDASRGGKGRAYYAEISAGQYATQEYVPAGPMLLTITGYDGVEVGDSAEGLHFKMGTTIFAPYHQRLDIDESTEAWNFEIPLDTKRTGSRGR